MTNPAVPFAPPRKHPKTKKAPPTAEEIERAKRKAIEKIEKIKADQAWLDKNIGNLSADEKAVLFGKLKKQCKNATMTDGKIIVQCPINRAALSRTTYCEYPDETTRIAPPAEKAETDIRDVNGSDVDVALLQKVEGNYGSPYVPWGPGVQYISQSDSLKAYQGHSGVTVGRGVDLGQFEDEDAQQEYLARLNDKLEAANVKEPERSNQVTRVSQFLGKKKGDACAALKKAKADKTSDLAPETVDAINEMALDDHVEELEAAYANQRKKFIKGQKAASRKANAPPKKEPRTFSELSTKERTLLLSAFYQEGSLQKTPHTGNFTHAVLAGDSEGQHNALEGKQKSSNKDYANRATEEIDFLDGEE